MTTLSIRVPDSLHRAIKELASKDGYSMNQFLITAAAEKLSALAVTMQWKSSLRRFLP
jgi:predicted HicB family RNase H-like nuclease